MINSEIESFGLVLADAINCNCSILISYNTGARSLLRLEEMDIINNCHDVDEVANKIKYICESRNAVRIMRDLDVDAVSPARAYEKLLNICKELTGEVSWSKNVK